MVESTQRDDNERVNWEEDYSKPSDRKTRMPKGEARKHIEYIEENQLRTNTDY